MADLLLHHADAVRAAALYGAIAIVALWELARPRRDLGQSIAVRWTSNLGMAALNAVLLRALLPVLSLGLAILAAERGWGLLNLWSLPGLVAGVMAFLALDAADYGVHRLFHAIPPLWRLHRVHHADLDVDFSTSLRHHPFEALLAAAGRLAVVFALGVPAAVIVVHEALRFAVDAFNHGNVRIAGSADRALRLLVVTPDMHRVHHSARRVETDSNFGSLLPWWDRLLGTYRAQPAGGQRGMTLGLERFRDPRDLHLHRMLAMPFRADAAPGAPAPPQAPGEGFLAP